MVTGPETAPEPGPPAELAPVLAWLRRGEAVRARTDFPTGTALPDGRLDMCKQDLGPLGAAAVADALPPGGGPVKHLLLGTDRLGDTGAATVAPKAVAARVETLYLGCNNIGGAGVCEIAGQLIASPGVVKALWLKRNPVGADGVRAVAETVRAGTVLRTVDLTQTGMTVGDVAVLVDAMIEAAERERRGGSGGRDLGGPGAPSEATHAGSDGGVSGEATHASSGDASGGGRVPGPAARAGSGGASGGAGGGVSGEATHAVSGSAGGGVSGPPARAVERLYLSGNRLGADGAQELARLLTAGAVAELYVSAARLGDSGASVLAEALRGAPSGTLRRLSVASNGIGPAALANLIAAAATAGVELFDAARVKAAAVLAADDNRLDEAGAATVAEALVTPHRLAYLDLRHTGVGSRGALRLLDGAQRAANPTRFVLGGGIAKRVKRELTAFAADIPASVFDIAPDVKAIRSVYRTAPPA